MYSFQLSNLPRYEDGNHSIYISPVKCAKVAILSIRMLIQPNVSLAQMDVVNVQMVMLALVVFLGTFLGYRYHNIIE